MAAAAAAEAPGAEFVAHVDDGCVNVEAVLRHSLRQEPDDEAREVRLLRLLFGATRVKGTTAWRRFVHRISRVAAAFDAEPGACRLVTFWRALRMCDSLRAMGDKRQFEGFGLDPDWVGSCFWDDDSRLQLVVYSEHMRDASRWLQRWQPVLFPDVEVGVWAVTTSVPT